MATALKNNEYIVFKPDQVLTDVQLNQLFYYLDNQNRVTRNKLIGMGIACGFELEIKMDNSKDITCITITKGCGITSEGYLISDCEDKNYGYAVPYTAPDLPNDLPFTCDNIPFYNTDCKIYKLVTYDQYKIIIETPGSTKVVIPSSPCSPSGEVSTISTIDNTDTDSTDSKQPIPLSSKDWSGYGVVLFLEVKEKDLKNCDTRDCDNGGEKMVFNIRPLLVPKKDCLKNNCSGDSDNLKAPDIKLKRFAVLTNDPANDISSASGILKTFQNIFNGASPNVLDEVAKAYSFCSKKYKAVLQITTDPFSSLSSNLSDILTGLQSNLLMTQYFYDYINDLILAYYEFREVTDEINIECCADECSFPLHLVLGDATKTTNKFIKDCWRTYFIYSPICSNNDLLEKLRFYFHRMEIMASQFNHRSFPIPEQLLDGDQLATDFIYANRKRISEIIKITPSQYEDFPLSQRAIPYYYPEFPDNAENLYKYWNLEKTIKGKEAFNLSYNSHQYSSNKLINDPLLYDIEKYNFFRIEGHIGLPYPVALIKILQAKQNYNLPFNVVAVAAENFFLTELDLQALLACLKDILTEFDSCAFEFLCKLILCTRSLARTKYSPLESGASTEAAIGEAELNPEDFLRAFQFKTGGYAKGNFTNFSSSGKDSMGEAYRNAIENDQYNNLVDIKTLNCDTLELGKSYYTGFNVLRAADNLFYILLNSKPQEITASVLEAQFKDFHSQFGQLKSQVTNNKLEIFSPALFDDCCDCLLCLFTKLLWLLEQIAKRIKLYESEVIFANYFKKHPGLEHKAGVPKGGTFVLVYDSIVHRRTGALGYDVADSYEMVAERIADIKETPVIIADFYIPYLCCSDCAPVVYINQPPQDNIQFDIQPNRFLFEDARKDYPFTISPFPADINEIENPEPTPPNIYIDGKTLYLHPAMEITETITKTLTYRKTPLSITIVKPDASFKITIADDPTRKLILNISLDADNKDADAVYECVIKEIATGNEIFRAGPVPSSTPSFSIDLPKDTSSFTVELTVTYTINDMKSTDNKIWKPDPASGGIPRGTFPSASE